ncbi:MAG: MmgE/PrpD family protein [Chloroflexi bacterium]|nr:MmgE/PrpD family protein [Chloroflexota bacterium]
MAETAADTASEPTISQRLGAFAAGLTADDLPAATADKVKALLLHALMVGLSSHAESDVALAARIALSEGGSLASGGARLLASGDRAARRDAAFVNSVLVHVRGQDDSYRMLTHPGCSIVPATLAEAEGRRVDGRTLLAALAAAYEVHCRLARDIVPSTQNHGFRSSALFGVFGPAVAAARLRGLDAEQTAHAIALAVSYAFGNLETSRAGTREMTFQEPVAAQSGMTAAALAAEGVTGAPQCIEGAVGFLYSFAGSAEGALTGSFVGAERIDVPAIAAELGQRWELLGATMKIYSGAGFVQPVIELCAQLGREHQIDAAQVREIRVEMNEWETHYPSPRFPRPATDEWNNAYFAAKALIQRGYASTGRRLSYGGRDAAGSDEPPEVQELSRRVRAVTADRGQYSPRVTVELVDGTTLVAEADGTEFAWDLATERARVPALYAALPFDAAHAERIAEAVANLESLDSVDALVDLCVARPG